MPRVLYPQWRQEHQATRYPFGDEATLVNDEGYVLLEGTFLDAALFPVGGVEGLYLSSVEVTFEEVILTIGDRIEKSRCSARFPLVSPPDEIVLEDAYGRPAGLLISEAPRLGLFQGWETGVHAFEPAQTRFAATVCLPTPEDGLRGILLEDGTLLTGDVWLVGDDGVVLREEEVSLAGPGAYRVVRVDVVGDPLYRRRLCEPGSLFDTPSFITGLRVEHPGGSFTCAPDGRGNLQITHGDGLVDDPALRVRTTPTGVRIEVVGRASL